MTGRGDARSSLFARGAGSVTGEGGLHTQAVIYAPFDAAGAPTVNIAQTVSGSCFTGSGASLRRDAWRCTNGNRLHDPCFSARRVNFVLCPTAPGSASAIKIELTKSLPGKFANKGKPSTSGLPWGLQISSGATCQLLTGATALVGHRRANYACTKTKNLLWGSPIRTIQPWTIFSAPFRANKLTHKVAIKTAWF